jgi:hypothetical protein
LIGIANHIFCQFIFIAVLIQITLPKLSIKGPQLFQGLIAASVCIALSSVSIKFVQTNIFLWSQLIIHLLTVLLYSPKAFHIANTVCHTDKKSLFPNGKA